MENDGRHGAACIMLTVVAVMLYMFGMLMYALHMTGAAVMDCESLSAVRDWAVNQFIEKGFITAVLILMLVADMLLCMKRGRCILVVANTCIMFALFGVLWSIVGAVLFSLCGLRSYIFGDC